MKNQAVSQQMADIVQSNCTAFSKLVANLFTQIGLQSARNFLLILKNGEQVRLNQDAEIIEEDDDEKGEEEEKEDSEDEEEDDEDEDEDEGEETETGLLLKDDEKEKEENFWDK